MILNALTAAICEWLFHHFRPQACAGSFLYLCSNVSLPSKSHEKRAKSLTDSVNFISGEKYQEHDSQLQAQLTRRGSQMNDVLAYSSWSFVKIKEVVQSLKMKTDCVTAPCGRGFVLKVTISQLGLLGGCYV